MKALQPKSGNSWNGYTLEQLAYARAITLARAEVERRHLAAEFDRTRQGNVLLSRNTFSKLLGLLSFTDFIVIGVKLWRSLSPVFSRKKHS